MFLSIEQVSRYLDDVGLEPGHGHGLHELGHVPVVGGAGGVDAVALLGAGHAAHDGGQLEAGGGRAGVDEALLGLEERSDAALHGVQVLLAGGVLGVGQAHELLGAVVVVLEGGLQEQVVQQLLLGDDLLDGRAAVAPLASATTTAATTAAPMLNQTK